MLNMYKADTINIIVEIFIFKIANNNKVLEKNKRFTVQQSKILNLYSAIL